MEHSKVLLIAKKHEQGARRLRVFVRFNDKTGVLTLSGSSWSGTGQVIDSLLEENVTYLDGWNRDRVVELRNIWKRWHLNNMRAGDSAQEEYLRYHKNPDEEYDYDETCEILRKANLLIHNGYRYGTKWLMEEIPDEVLCKLFSYPGVGNTYDDIRPPEILEQDFIEIIGGVCSNWGGRL